MSMLNGLMASNPRYKETMELIQEHNGNAEAAFYEKAKEMGIDPEQVLNVLR